MTEEAMGNHGISLFKFSFQSWGISFPEWISLFTLCFAPLVAHIISGAPTPVYLCWNRPGLLDRICILNPTTIMAIFCHYRSANPHRGLDSRRHGHLQRVLLDGPGMGRVRGHSPPE